MYMYFNIHVHVTCYMYLGVYGTYMYMYIQGTDLHSQIEAAIDMYMYIDEHLLHNVHA